jgi:RNA polymerase primary sigma factor
MKTYCHLEIAQLAHELSLAPLRQRLRQVYGLFRCLELIDERREYPYSFICYQVTGYRSRRTADTLLAGRELIGDLNELLDDLTADCPLPADAVEGVLFDAETLAGRFRVSTKTISRWRKRGLPACWYVGAEGKSRLGFPSRGVQRFAYRHQELIQRGGQFAIMSADEKASIVQRARELVATEKCSLHGVTIRLSEETGRAVETIRYTLRRFDRDHPEHALFDGRDEAKPLDQNQVITQAYLAGDTTAQIASRFGLRPSQVTRIVTTGRAKVIAETRVDYIYNAAFDAPGAEKTILGGSTATSVVDEAPMLHAKPPADLPPYLQDLYRTPLLSKSEETDQFRRMNYLLHQAAGLQTRIAADVDHANPADIAAYDEKTAAARDVKNRIIQANLRLVVSIAKRHLSGRAAANLFELISDGNVALMRAVEKFDYSRGFAFSTYASWAIMRGFARSIPEELSRSDRFQTGHDEFLAVTRDTRPIETPRQDEQEAVTGALAAGLAVLDDRERTVIQRRYGLGGQPGATLEDIGRDLGLSKERVRQIERRALQTLRAQLGEHRAELLAG